MPETLTRLIEAFKSSSFPILLVTAVHASSSFWEKTEDDDPVPGDNFPQLKG